MKTNDTTNQQLLEVLYDLNVGMLFSIEFDNVKARDIRQLMEIVLTKHGIWKEFQDYTGIKLHIKN